MNRRQALQTFVNSALQAAGAVVLASSALASTEQQAPEQPGETDIKKRADQVAATQEPADDTEDGASFTSFVNGGFVNGGGFRKGGFANGGFRNGGFRKGGFANGGFGNGGGFRKGGFANG
jgi:rSAM-associated Gly-rich repeat protein